MYIMTVKTEVMDFKENKQGYKGRFGVWKRKGDDAIIL